MYILCKILLGGGGGIQKLKKNNLGGKITGGKKKEGVNFLGYEVLKVFAGRWGFGTLYALEKKEFQGRYRNGSQWNAFFFIASATGLMLACWC